MFQNIGIQSRERALRRTVASPVVILRSKRRFWRKTAHQRRS